MGEREKKRHYIDFKKKPRMLDMYGIFFSFCLDMDFEDYDGMTYILFSYTASPLF